MTRPELHEWVRRLFHERTTQKLSVQALETLAVIAYKQPITAPEIAEIRGVNSSGGVLTTLLERHLIKIVGRKQVVGRPFMYATTREFLDRFGLNDLTDLPKVEDMADALGFELPNALLEPTVDDVAAAVRRARRRSIQARTPVENRQTSGPVRSVGSGERHRALSVRPDRSDFMPQIRLQKILSTAGIASRRAAEALITQGRVTVNDTTVTGARIEGGSRGATTSGSTAGASSRRHGAATSCSTSRAATSPAASDPQHRPTVIDLLARHGDPRLRLSGRAARLRVGRPADPDERRRPGSAC